MGDYLVLTVHEAYDSRIRDMNPDGYLERLDSLIDNDIKVHPQGEQVYYSNRNAMSDGRRKYDAFLGDPKIVDTIVDQILTFLESDESSSKDLARFGMKSKERGLFKPPAGVRDRFKKKQYGFTAALKNAIEKVAQELDVPLITPLGVYNEFRYILILAPDGSVV